MAKDGDGYLGLLSPDGQYRWNGQDWEQVPRSPAGPLSPDGRYRWDGSQWVPTPAPPKQQSHDGSGGLAKIALLWLVALALLAVIFSDVLR